MAGESRSTRGAAQAFWGALWISRGRSAAVGLASSLLIASAIYGFTWFSFYDTRTHGAEARAERVADDLHRLAGVAAGAPDAGRAIRETLGDYLESASVAVTVTYTRGTHALWTQSSAVGLDTRRTLVERAFEIPVEGRPGEALHVGVRQSVRPPLWLALGRAWTFSALTLLEDPETWRSQRLWNRSFPLYGTWLVVGLVGLGTVRALHRDQVALAAMRVEAEAAAVDLESLRAEHAAEVDWLRSAALQSESQREEARRQRERLAAEIARAEREIDDLERTRAGAADADLGMTVSLDRIREMVRRKSEIERELASHDAQVEHADAELEAAREELGAAEELLQELEARQSDLSSKLRDRNREIRSLRSATREARALHETHARIPPHGTHRSSPSEAPAATNGLDEQLRGWLVSTGEAKVNFSEHSKSARIQAQFEKIDRDFVDRCFTHVVNPEYARGARRTIRVVAEDGHGELVVALDDDIGRTLGLRFELRKAKGIPDAAYVGFALALLLRTHCRDFRDFGIRTR